MGAPLFGHRYPIDSVSNFLDMADEGDIPGIPSATINRWGQIADYKLIWNGEIVEDHLFLKDLGIQDDDELILVLRPPTPRASPQGQAVTSG